MRKDTVEYWKNYPELGINKCAKNLGIGKSTLSTWAKYYEENKGTVPTRVREYFESDEAKERCGEDGDNMAGSKRRGEASRQAQKKAR